MEHQSEVISIDSLRKEQVLTVARDRTMQLFKVGFINSLAFAKSREFLVAGVGQEPQLGRWGCLPAARNGIAIQRLKLA